ncbi:trimethyllysine dioxygenase [Synchytrium endobioticum]|uniref:trimethyllysine dioxygenase n=1 Tax=Synchytrium endobioticum TaxID=286115 RepID=A0A507D5R4_9FUNG|nr:trimethyllysine dioxygenase [Synchytrium endobioticum]
MLNKATAGAKRLLELPRSSNLISSTSIRGPPLVATASVRLQHSPAKPASSAAPSSRNTTTGHLWTRVKPEASAKRLAAVSTQANSDLADVIGTTTRIENRKISVTFVDGQETAYNFIWLRDHCRCPKCHHTITKQRLVDTFSIPGDIRPSSVVTDDLNDTLIITWSHDNHQSIFPLSFLRQHSYAPSLPERPALRHKVLWNASLADALPITRFEDVMNSDQGLAQWLLHLDVYGFGIVDGCPPAAAETEKLVQRIAFLRRTHYGDFWDFTADLEHGDTAYTAMALPAHTDNTYFTDPAGLQIFHMIENTCEGGKSLYVDGFHVANELARRHPWAYKALSTIRTPAHAAGDPTQIIMPKPSAHPLLNIDPATSQLYQIRFNNDDRSVLDSLSSEEVELYYDALREWTRLVRSPDNELWMQLYPGRVVAMDNWRVMHGRSGFGPGIRRICGAYVGNDDWTSRMRVVLDKSEARKRI